MPIKEFGLTVLYFSHVNPPFVLCAATISRPPTKISDVFHAGAPAVASTLSEASAVAYSAAAAIAH